MGTIDYEPVNTYGMYFSLDTLIDIAKEISIKTGIEHTVGDAIEHLNLTVCEDFIGKVYPVLPDGSDDEFSLADFQNEEIYIYRFDAQLNLFDGSQFNRFSECTKELRKVIGKCVPKDFDFKSNVHHIIGVRSAY